MHRLQVPLDAAPGQPSLFPQGGDQAEQIDSQPLFPQRRPAQVRLGHPTFLTYGANPGDKDVFGDLDGNQGKVDDFPGALPPAPSQAGTTLWTGFQGVLHPVGGRHAKAGKAVRPGLPGAFLPGAFLPGSLLAAGLGLDAGHPFGAAGLGLSLQGFNAPLQLVNHRLLAGNDRQQGFPWSGGEVKAGVHVSDLT